MAEPKNPRENARRGPDGGLRNTFGNPGLGMYSVTIYIPRHTPSDTLFDRCAAARGKLIYRLSDYTAVFFVFFFVFIFSSMKKKTRKTIRKIERLAVLSDVVASV